MAFKGAMQGVPSGSTQFGQKNDTGNWASPLTRSAPRVTFSFSTPSKSVDQGPVKSTSNSRYHAYTTSAGRAAAHLTKRGGSPSRSSPFWRVNRSALLHPGGTAAVTLSAWRLAGSAERGRTRGMPALWDISRSTTRRNAPAVSASALIRSNAQAPTRSAASCSGPSPRPKLSTITSFGAWAQRSRPRLVPSGSKHPPTSSSLARACEDDAESRENKRMSAATVASSRPTMRCLCAKRKRPSAELEAFCASSRPPRRRRRRSAAAPSPGALLAPPPPMLNATSAAAASSSAAVTSAATGGAATGGACASSAPATAASALTARRGGQRPSAPIIPSPRARATAARPADSPRPTLRASAQAHVECRRALRDITRR
mmetsp:Transcript_18946/g.58931  ORF Transcript_18946/g.58931 Transcript_18946/m.58931 type:complete len:373 (+) Transcript_18946:606-1724(+)